MTDWKYEELIESLKDQKFTTETYLQFAKENMAKYKNITETDDKFEVMFHNYWRGTIIELEKQVTFLIEILENYNQNMLEDIREIEALEENDRDLKHSASLGI